MRKVLNPGRSYTEPEALMPAFFSDPVIVWLDPARPDFGVRLIRNVPEGLAALHRHKLNDALRNENAHLWHSAANALRRADANQTSENIQDAFEALLRLTKKVAPVPSSIRLTTSPRGLREHVQAFFDFSGTAITS